MLMFYNANVRILNTHTYVWINCLIVGPTVGPGFYPPLMHQLPLPEDPGQWAVDPSYSVIHGAEAKAKAKGIGRGRKYNLMAQVIPIYGFGIFLYIFYIIYKVPTAWLDALGY